MRRPRSPGRRVGEATGRTSGGHKCRYSPLVELIHGLQIPDSRVDERDAQKYMDYRDDEHYAILPHDLLDGVQARVRNHLDYVPVLPSTNLHSSPLTVVRLACTCCARKSIESPSEGGSRPAWKVRSKRRCGRLRGLGGVMRQAVERRVRR